MKLKIGKRNLKTAIAVFLSVLISKIAKLEYPFFTVIAAIFSMENSIASSYKAGFYRILGSIVGAFVGVIFVLIAPGNAILSGIGTLIFIAICNMLNWNRAVPIAGTIFASIMFSLNNKNPVIYSFSRISDTFIGITIAVLVNYFIFPPNNILQMRKNIDCISEKISDFISQSICQRKDLSLDALRKEIIASINFLEDYKAEFNPKIDQSSELSFISSKLASLRDILYDLKTVNELNAKCGLNSDNLEKLKLLNLCDIVNTNYSDNNLNIIYNYHINQILSTLSLLTKNGNDINT